MVIIRGDGGSTWRKPARDGWMPATDNSGHAHQYTCKHHPEVVRETPGNCPKCGMKLVEKQ